MTRGGAVLPFMPATDLDSSHNRRLVVVAASLASRPTAHERLVHLDRILATDDIALWAYHPGSEFVKHLERRLVALDAELALELEGRLSRRLRRHEVRAPKPYRQRRVAGLHGGARSERNVGLTRAAPQNDRRAPREAVRLTYVSTPWASKPVRPSQLLKVFRASRVIREHALEFGKSRRKAARIHGPKLASLRLFGNEPDRHGLNHRTQLMGAFHLTNRL